MGEMPQSELIEKFEYANIRPEYWHLTFDDIKFDDDSVKKDLLLFVDNLNVAVNKGLGLFLYGDFGQGKTLIASMILKVAMKAGFTAYFISAFDFLNCYGGFSDENEQFRRFTRNIDVLVIDDLGSESVKARDYTFSLLDNLLVERFKPVILTSNRSSKTIGNIYGEHLLEFIGTGKIKELFIDNGQNLRGKFNWEEALTDIEERKPVW